MIVEELRSLFIFAGAPDNELQWMVDHSREVVLNDGDYVARENEPANSMYIVLEGEIQVARTINGTLTVLGTTPPGIIGGELPLLSGTPSQTTASVLMPTRLMVLDVQAFRQMFGACPTIAANMLQVAGERTQNFASVVKQHEKMSALSQLSAGLAHELNNPAAAARRSAQTLQAALPELQAQTLLLNSLGLQDAQMAQLIELQQQASRHVASGQRLAPLAQSDREDELGNLLATLAPDNGWEMASVFVGAGLTRADLEALTTSLPSPTIGSVLAWLHQTVSAVSLLDEIVQGTRRISELVSTVKAYTYMDQAPLQEVDIHKGLEDTLTILHSKLQAVTVIREYGTDVPMLWARGSELNQVWTSLIDNAIDATQGQGTLWLKTRDENSHVMVEITDDGPGIPSELQARVFEPFYTTKEVGIGTGLGLDVSYRIIRQHNGTIELRSEPGNTRFIVRIPVSGNDANEQANAS